MEKLLVSIILFTFCLSPAVFGANIQNAQTAADLYKNAYVNYMQGEDAGQVLRDLGRGAAENKISIKEVLDAGVAKEWMTQDQANHVQAVAAKYSYLANDPNFIEKVQAKAISASDIQTLATSMQGDVTGAGYYCQHFGCFSEPFLAVFFVLIIVSAILATAIGVVYY